MFTNVLSKNAKEALALLGKANLFPKDTYLAGGSALTLHLGHRISIDLDFFTPHYFIGKEIALKLNKLAPFQLQETDEKNTLLGFFNKVKFSLFRYPYPLLFKPTVFQNILIADPKDIMPMKLAAIMDRGTKKDFIDLYFLCKRIVSLDEGFNYYEKKYKALSNNIYSLIKAISYFDDAEKEEMPQMIEKVVWEKIKKFFEKEAIRLAKKYL